MNKQTEALKLVLEALDVLLTEPIAHKAANKAECLLLQAAPAIRSALAEEPASKQEPVAYMVKAHGMLQRFSRRADVADELACQYREDDPNAEVLPLYTSPPASKPLTDEQREQIYQEWASKPFDEVSYDDLMLAIEAAHKIGVNK